MSNSEEIRTGRTGVVCGMISATLSIVVGLAVRALLR